MQQQIIYIYIILNFTQQDNLIYEYITFNTIS